MTLQLTVPRLNEAEHIWICKVIFQHFLGLEYDIKWGTPTDTLIKIEAEDQALTLPMVFFKELSASSLTLPEVQFLSSTAVAPLPMPETDLPILYGTPEFTLSPNHIHCGLDLLGSCFFLLTCYEETLNSDRDGHGRFLAKSSVLFKNHLLERPVVDEYTEFLWSMLYHLWPSLKRKTRVFKKNITCDVDVAYSYEAKGLYPLLHSVGAQLLKHRNVKQAFQKGRNGFASLMGHYQFEPNHTFEWMMDVNEQAQNTLSFYFIVSQAHPKDAHYAIQESRMQTLLKRIHQRKHHLGLHASYMSFDSQERISTEVSMLQQLCDTHNISQPALGSRQHYLRWDSHLTPDLLSQTALRYDTSLGFADHPGFRAGTCHPFPMFSVTHTKELNLWQRPLVLMECTVIDSHYMGLGYTDTALEKMLNIKRTCQKYQGLFTLLWHNSLLITPQDRAFYLELIR